MGLGLRTALAEAGLSVARAEAIARTPSPRHDIGAIVRAILPRIVTQGVATGVEIDIDTLDRPPDDEGTGTNGTYGKAGGRLDAVGFETVGHVGQ
jgi:hypothetical protein